MREAWTLVAYAGLLLALMALLLACTRAHPQPLLVIALVPCIGACGWAAASPGRSHGRSVATLLVLAALLSASLFAIELRSLLLGG